MNIKKFTPIMVLVLAACRFNLPSAPQPVQPEAETQPAQAAAKTLPAQTKQNISPVEEGINAFEGVPPSELFEVDWTERAIFTQNLVPEAQHWAKALPQATQYRIELLIPENVDRLTGREEVLYTNQEEVSLNEVYLRLFPNVNGGAATIETLRVNGQPAEFNLESLDSAVRIPLVAPLLPGESLLLQLDFTLEIPRQMGGNFGLFGYFENILTLDLFYPAVPAYDQQGWYADPPPPYGDNSYYDASYYLVRVTAPEDFVLATSGVEVLREAADGFQTVTFAAGPARDFSLAASIYYTLLSDTTGSTRVNSFALAKNASAQRLVLDVAMKAIETFSSRIGEFEYSEFDVIATPMQAGGVEYPGATWINMDYYNLDKEFYGLPAANMLETVVAHEVAHHWFYNVVGNSQVEEAWLDESLVQYVTGLYFLDQHGQDAYRSYKTSWDYRWGRIDFKNVPIGLPSGAYSGYEYVSSVYGRGPYFFETLAREIGDEVFRGFLHDYYQTYQWQVATGAGMKDMLEQHCRCDLMPLFQEWVYPAEP